MSTGQYPKRRCSCLDDRHIPRHVWYGDWLNILQSGIVVVVALVWLALVVHYG